MIIFKYIISGIIIKAIASVDDFLTRIPLIAALTKTRKGKIAFSFGNLLAVIIVIVLASIFAGLINRLPYSNFISAGLILILAILVYFEVFVVKPKSNLEKKLLKIEKISAERFIKLIGIGFIISFLTLVDDAVVFAGLFLGKNILSQFIIALGIILITLIQLFLLIYFSEKISKLKYKKEIATIAMIILAILILLQKI